MDNILRPIPADENRTNFGSVAAVLVFTKTLVNTIGRFAMLSITSTLRTTRGDATLLRTFENINPKATLTAIKHLRIKLLGFTVFIIDNVRLIHSGGIN